MDSPRRVVVVGAGAAGIFAAWRAASLGASVVLLEKTPRVGTKILISGGGKCNITHDGPMESVLKPFRLNEARFIRPACYRFPNTKVVEMLTSRGLEVYTRPDGRIFPVNQTAKDVVAILCDYLIEVGVDVRLRTPVTGLTLVDRRVTGVQTGEGLVSGDAVVLAVGGSSYPNSGTTGDGWNWAREVGHTVITPRAALAPIELRNANADWSGVALRDVVLRVRAPKEVTRWRGDLLFTHHGISGPTALGVSRIVAEHVDRGPVELEVDLRPDVIEEDLAAELLVRCQGSPKKMVASITQEYIPERLVDALLESAGVDPTTPAGRLERKNRNRLAATIKRWSLGTVKRVPLEKGEVTAGGIDLDEVDAQTMASKRVEGLFLCGEVLDIAGPVGGYNLQAAFATGFVAGESATISAT